MELLLGLVPLFAFIALAAGGCDDRPRNCVQPINELRVPCEKGLPTVEEWNSRGANK
jgi:hypothetical protein